MPSNPFDEDYDMTAPEAKPGDYASDFIVSSTHSSTTSSCAVAGVQEVEEKAQEVYPPPDDISEITPHELMPLGAGMDMDRMRTGDVVLDQDPGESANPTRERLFPEGFLVYPTDEEIAQLARRSLSSAASLTRSADVGADVVDQEELAVNMSWLKRREARKVLPEVEVDDEGVMGVSRLGGRRQRLQRTRLSGYPKPPVGNISAILSAPTLPTHPLNSTAVFGKATWHPLLSRQASSTSIFSSSSASLLGNGGHDKRNDPLSPLTKPRRKHVAMEGTFPPLKSHLPLPKLVKARLSTSQFTKSHN